MQHARNLQLSDYLDTDFWLDSSSDAAVKRFMLGEKLVCVCEAEQH